MSVACMPPLRVALSGSQSLQHPPTARAKQIGDHMRHLETGVLQALEHPVLGLRAHLYQGDPSAGEVP